MMKFKVSFFAMCVLMILGVMTSCEKVALPEDFGTDTQKGNLRISIFEIEKTPFASLTRALEAPSEACARLNYVIYTTDGERLKQVNQTSDNVNFGNCSFQLEQGTYQLVIVGHSSNGNPTMTDPKKIQFTNAQGFTDTFLYCEYVTIGEETVDLNVSLNRIVSMCRIVITDDFPTNITKMRFYYTGGSGAFNAQTGLGCVNSKQLQTFDVTENQQEFDLYTFLHDTEGTIHLTITALDANGSELYDHTTDVTMEQNHITWLTGALFNGSTSSSTSTTVTINTAWAGEKHLTF